MLTHVLTALFAFSGIYCFKQMVGPYDIILHKLYQCDGMPVNENNFKYGVHLVKYNKTSVLYTSNITIPRGFHDGMKVVSEFAVFRKGAWKRNYINFRLDHACTDFNNVFSGFVHSFMKSAGTNFTRCPIKSGSYEVKDWLVDLKVANGIFPYGTYKITTSVFDSGRKVLCVILELDAVPFAS